MSQRWGGKRQNNQLYVVPCISLPLVQNSRLHDLITSNHPLPGPGNSLLGECLPNTLRDSGLNHNTAVKKKASGGREKKRERERNGKKNTF